MRNDDKAGVFFLFIGFAMAMGVLIGIYIVGAR